MAASRLPGHLDPVHKPHLPVDRGTTCRASSPEPGTVGRDATAELDLAGRIGEALKMVPAHLPESLAAEARAFLTAENVAIMAGGLAALGVAQFFGVGEVVDVVLLGVGAFFAGAQVGGAARGVAAFVAGCVTARSRADLDRAAAHMAEAVVVGGVAVLSMLLLLKGHQASRARAVLAGEAPLPGVRYVTVGRWMSEAEYNGMTEGGKNTYGPVLESPDGGKNVVYPPTPEFYKAAPAGHMFVQFDVPESSLVEKSLNQKMIPATRGARATLAARRGQPAPQMPRAFNIKVMGRKP